MNGGGFLLGFLLSLLMLIWLLVKLGSWKAPGHPRELTGDRREADPPGPGEEAATTRFRTEQEAMDGSGPAAASPSVEVPAAVGSAAPDRHGPQQGGRPASDSIPSDPS